MRKSTRQGGRGFLPKFCESISGATNRVAWCAILLLALQAASAAGKPAISQTYLYFPHIASGGPPGGQLQTRFTFVNPNNSTATVSLLLLGYAGTPLALDFGSGPTSLITFTIAARGTVVLRNSAVPAAAVTGWAFASASLPIYATSAFRFVINGSTVVEITAEPTLPSTGYTSVATPQVGVVVANPYLSPLPVVVTVLDGSGNTLGTTNLTLPPLGHSSFNLSAIPNLPASFTGSVRVTPVTPGWKLIAWAVYSDSSGAISSLPDGRDGFPISQTEQIDKAFRSVVAAFQAIAPPGVPGLPSFGPVPQLVISPESDSNAINAFAAGGNTVTVNLALAELISDSPSELAWVIAHELGHIYQQRNGGLKVWNADVEWDADIWGALIALAGGYDPYAAAGTLGKLGMATGTANLGVQLWEDLLLPVDAHGSFSTRIDNLTVSIQEVCALSPAIQASCSNYKQVVHPHFPALPTVPLARPKVPIASPEP
jgi:hypothetical protein